ncbi:hypothetical protein X975_10341, partial [Stegodyphus mimosarum]
MGRRNRPLVPSITTTCLSVCLYRRRFINIPETWRGSPFGYGFFPLLAKRPEVLR